jgi:O-antigen/teichoic acid export membrane protein
MSGQAELLLPLPPAEVGQRAARGGVVVAAAQLARGLLEAAGTLFLTRALLPADFGLVDMIVSVTGIIGLLKDFGLSSAIIQRQQLEHAQVSLLFWINCAIGLLLTLITAGLAPVLALVYGRPELFDLTLGVSLSIFLGALSVQHMALLRRNLQFSALAKVEVASSVLCNACAVASAYHGAGAWALVVRQLVWFLSQALLSWLICPFRPTAPRRSNVRDLLRFGTHVSGFQVLNYMERNVDNILLGRFAGAEALGYYAKAYGLMRVPLDQINTLSSVTVPAFSRLCSDGEHYRRVYQSVTRVLLLFTIPLAPLFIYSAPWLIPTVMGAQWEGSTQVFQWLALGLIIKPLLNTTGWLYMSQGRTRELLRIGALGSAIAIASFVAGLPWGALGVAISYVLVDIFVRAPLILLSCGSAGPVRTRHLLATLAPAWTACAVIAVTYPATASLLGKLQPGLRVAICSCASLAAAALVMASTSWGRHAFADGLRIVRSLRDPRSGADASDPSQTPPSSGA